MDDLIKLLRENIVTFASVLTALGVIWKICGKPLESIVKKIDRIDEDTADLLWDRLVQMHDCYIERGYASSSDKERIAAIFKHYKAKGRNHLAESFVDDVLHLPSRRINHDEQ